jgi:hypothetical protein
VVFHIHDWYNHIIIYLTINFKLSNIPVHFPNIKQMRNKQQTAVEWLIEELTNNGINHLDLAHEIIEQAKEMEKECIKKAWADGNYNTDDDGNPSENYSISDEHYYEQTYGGNNEQ